ncbi:esterase-like activity of phytase family protein [Novosphingobium soli]|uniref:Esterase-like activity of phytase family protein n=1 Tax=Novosphingobium soli TaxID=574956 RepID=A0ABV6D0Z4_9SPHN
MRRTIALFLAASVLGLTWARSDLPPAPMGPRPELGVKPMALPSAEVLARQLGPFALEGAWQIVSSHEEVYGYSALTVRPDGVLLAFSDGGKVLAFSPPGARPQPPRTSSVKLADSGREKSSRDVESATWDPVSGRFWLGLEGTNRIVRLSPEMRETGRIAPPAMRRWGPNSGAEAMARLHDGRFVAIREVTSSWIEGRSHEALLFAGDPIENPEPAHFRLDGPDAFSVVDMAELPDGRALILMRRLVWPMPMRFAGRIVIADTARIRPGAVWHSVPLASLESPLPVDNFEAIAVQPRADGRIVVWLMSDDNNWRVLQRTLLWKLSVDPAQLPWPK